MSDVDHIGELVFAKPIHEPSQEAMSRQAGRAISHDGQCVSPMTLGDGVDPFSEFAGCGFRWKIHPGRQHDTTGLDKHRDDRLIGVEAHQVRDDGQQLVWLTHLESA